MKLSNTDQIESFSVSAVLLSCLLASSNSFAEILGNFDNVMYYTDDVGLFSVTRRISLKEDPTQAVVDEPGQGSDFVYEPNFVLTWEESNGAGEFSATFDAGAYIFTNKHDYTHGFFQIQLAQNFHNGSELNFFYDFIPNLLLGKQEIVTEHHHEAEYDERLDNHIWALHIDKKTYRSLNSTSIGKIWFALLLSAFRTSQHTVLDSRFSSGMADMQGYRITHRLSL